MYAIDQEVTDGYEHFLDTGRGFGVDLTLRWRDQDMDEMMTSAVKCELKEVEDILAERLGPILNRDEDDPDFADEISELVSDIKGYVMDGEGFHQSVGPCEIKARGLEHPLSTAITVKQGGGIYLQTRAYRLKRGDDLVRLAIQTPDGVKMGFMCVPEEGNALLAATLKRLSERSSAKLDGGKIRNFLASAQEPKAAERIGDALVFVENTAIKPKVGKKQAFSEEDIQAFQDSSYNLSEPPIEQDDETLNMLKKMREPDVVDDEAQDMPEKEGLATEPDAEMLARLEREKAVRATLRAMSKAPEPDDRPQKERLKDLMKLVRQFEKEKNRPPEQAVQMSLFM